MTNGERAAMKRRASRTSIARSSRFMLALPFVFGASLGMSLSVAPARGDDDLAIPPRAPWTTSRLRGSPDPPLPYTVEKVFETIEWRRPLYIAREPGTRSLVVVEQGGEPDRPSRAHRVVDVAGASSAEVFLELERLMIYGVAFHPDYERNGRLFVFAHGPPGESPRWNRILSYRVSRDPPFAWERASEELILEWRSEGHDGGDMVFGKDGMLYIATGDGTSDSDLWSTGQDVSDLLGAVLRIDVDRRQGELPYAVPKDNPFVGVEGARPELWAFGLRNPWRMTIDERTGAIWIGNNGQDLWETVHLLERGANFGWSIYEGSHPFYLQRALGPTPPVAPTIEHHHREARSLTGGVVYYGDALSELDGAYVYGDYSTGKIWGARHDGSRVTWHRELADTSLQIAAFAVGQRGDLYIVDHGSGIYRLVPRDGGDEGRDTQEGDGAFPTRLSETGILASVVERTPALGVVPYDVIVPAWHDGAVAERLIAVPEHGKISYTGSRGWAFPDGSVLVQTLSIVAETPDEENAKRERLRPIETRILLRQEGEWAGYAYLWNDARTDAELVDAKGAEIDIEPLGEGGRGRRRAWRVPSRAECLSCHSRAAGFVLGLSAPQMSRERDYGGVRANQILALRAMGLLDGAPRTKEALERIPRLVDPYDSSFDLEDRARSYLHASCSSCHVEAGGGNATMELEITRERERMNLIGARPQHAVFGLENAMIVAPGDPDRSVLVERLRRRGSGQMPPFGSTIADERAVALFREWIESLREVRPIVRRWTLEALVPGLDRLKEERSFESGREAFRVARCGDCHRLGDATGTIGPDLSRLSKDRSAREILEAIVEPSRSIAPEYAFTVIVTNDGRVITGRIEREDAGAVVLRPAASGEAPIAIERSAIAARSPSDVSSMPEGTIDTLTEDEILDLLAYLIAGGDREHPSFHRARR